MTLKKSTSLAIIALAASVWIGCSSKEDKEKYDHFYGSGSKAREETALVTLQNERKNAKVEATPATQPAATPAATGAAATGDTTAAAKPAEPATAAAP